MTPTAPLKPCPAPLCSALVASGRCSEHQRPAFARRRAPSKRPMGNGWAWDRKKRQIHERDGYRCYLCGGRAVTVDHILNRARGGTDSDDNLAAICAACHRKKTARESWQGRQPVGRSESSPSSEPRDRRAYRRSRGREIPDGGQGPDGGGGIRSLALFHGKPRRPALSDPVRVSADHVGSPGVTAPLRPGGRDG